MSAYDDLQMFYKRTPTPAGEIKDPWALGHYLAEKYGNHTQAEYAKALEDKQYSKDWNPLTAAAKEKKAKSDAKKKGAEAEDKPKKGRAKAGTKKYGSPGRQARMKLSLDESLALLNLLKGDKIKEDKKDEHEDKEPIKQED